MPYVLWVAILFAVQVINSMLHRRELRLLREQHAAELAEMRSRAGMLEAKALEALRYADALQRARVGG